MKLERRLAVEEELLKRTFGSSFRIQDPGSPTVGVVGAVKTSSSEVYALWIPLRRGSDRFPDSAPAAYVVSPTLRTRKDRKLSEFSHAMHVLERDDEGHPRICYMDDSTWTASMTLYKVVVKIQIWLVAYEEYLATGRKPDRFLVPAP
jgi:hypothetical protein